VEDNGSYVRRITRELKVKEKRNKMLRKRRQISGPPPKKKKVCVEKKWGGIINEDNCDSCRQVVSLDVFRFCIKY